MRAIHLISLAMLCFACRFNGLETFGVEKFESVSAPAMASVTVEKESEPVIAPLISEYEYNLLCRVCMSECGGKWGEEKSGKVAVVSTILNRVDMGMGSIEEVIYEPYQYSTADNGEPDETVREAVDYALFHRNEHPKNMIYFRTDYYHDFGSPYMKIGSHYFSLEIE